MKNKKLKRPKGGKRLAKYRKKISLDISFEDAMKVCVGVKDVRAGMIREG